MHEANPRIVIVGEGWWFGSREGSSKDHGLRSSAIIGNHLAQTITTLGEQLVAHRIPAQSLIKAVVRVGRFVVDADEFPTKFCSALLLFFEG